MRVVPHRLHRRRHSRGTHKYSSTNQCISHPSSSRTRPTLAGTSDGPVWELSLSRSRYTRWIRQAQVKTWKRKRSSRSQTRRQSDSTMTSPAGRDSPTSSSASIAAGTIPVRDTQGHPPANWEAGTERKKTRSKPQTAGLGAPMSKELCLDGASSRP